MSRMLHREDLVQYAKDHAPSRACRRAFFEGRTEVLGGFHASPVAPLYNGDRWILRITSVRGRVWLLAVRPPASMQDGYSVYEIDRVPWKEWAGKPQDVPGANTVSGDYPVGSWLNKQRKDGDERDRTLDSTGSGAGGQDICRHTSEPPDGV